MYFICMKCQKCRPACASTQTHSTFEVITYPPFKYVIVKIYFSCMEYKKSDQPALPRRLISTFEVITYPQFKYLITCTSKIYFSRRDYRLRAKKGPAPPPPF